ncbi:hypothetical protein QTP70_028290 [Hemibagrus guttatus]|uniref:ZP domain-containing protein n=1 Tax=Hemibagrus guttatus TaxID=175788 RepID=A0AAE0V0G3_9TELE|nr:hypothetical protein QTP70_028290 [Hemibagrus guttatus]
MLSLLCLTVLTLASKPVLSLYNCSSLYERVPNNDDLKVDCGVSAIKLNVNLCTAQWAGFDPTGLALNGMHNNSQCKGTIDTSVDPPVIRYELAVNDSQGNLCRQSLQIVDEVPSAIGPFSQFSNIQSVIITSFIDTPTSSVGVVSYSTDLYYRFSCRYPLQYLINNTKIVASSVSVATNEKNGSFVDTLSMSVYNDSTFSYPLVVPTNGLQLRTKVYIEVKAVNLSGKYDNLIARRKLNKKQKKTLISSWTTALQLHHLTPSTTAKNLTSSLCEKYSFCPHLHPASFTVLLNSLCFTHKESVLFLRRCTAYPLTVVLRNGISQNSRFSFEAFRFVEHRNQDKSSIYIHCILRLCEPDKCLNILNVSKDFHVFNHGS